MSDFSSSFKPVYLPEDDPADYNFYFDTSGRRACYLAPERFHAVDGDESKRKKGTASAKENEAAKGKVTEAMDVFSAGCVLAEILLDGKPMFNLASLFKYRAGESSIEGVLKGIEDEQIRVSLRYIFIVGDDHTDTNNRVLSVE